VNSLVQAWDAVADRLDEYPLAMERVRYAVGIRPLLALPRTARIADLGCGSGRLLRALDAAGFGNLAGVEICPQRLEQVRRSGPQGVELHCTERVPFEPGSLDAAVSTGVVEHVADPSAWLAQVARAVRPGGIVSITSDTYMWRWLQGLGLYRTIQPIDRAIAPGTMIRMARRAGLRLTACGSFYNTPDQRFYLLKQLARLSPRLKRLRWYLARGERPAAVVPDDARAIGAALDLLPAQARFGRFRCIFGYESFYWFRRVEGAAA
jgi:SAM-dependent methyltransferase